LKICFKSLLLSPRKQAKDVAIPVDQIDRYEDKCVCLKMDKKSVENLPDIHIDSKKK